METVAECRRGEGYMAATRQEKPPGPRASATECGRSLPSDDGGRRLGRQATTGTCTRPNRAGTCKFNARGRIRHAGAALASNLLLLIRPALMAGKQTYRYHYQRVVLFSFVTSCVHAPCRALRSVGK